MAQNYRGTLNQFAQKNPDRAPKLPEFIDLGSTGFQMNKIFHCKCEFIIDGRLLSTTASARKKKLAFRDCARRMMEKIERLPQPPKPKPAPNPTKGTFYIGMKVRAKWNDTNRFYDGVVESKNVGDNTYDIFWPQWRNKTEKVKPDDIQTQPHRSYVKGRLRVRDGKAGIDVVCQPKGIVITDPGEQPEMKKDDTLVSINDCNLKGMMPDDQAQIWKDNMSNGVEFVIEREIERPKKNKAKGPTMPMTDAHALNRWYIRNRHTVKMPPQYNIVREMGMPHNRVYSMECVIERNDGTNLKVTVTARSKKKAKQDASRKMVALLGEEIKSKTGGGAGTKRTASSAGLSSSSAAKKTKVETKPLHERLQTQAEEAYEKYTKEAAGGDQARSQKFYKEYESLYKRYAEEYRKYAAAQGVSVQ